MLPIVLNCGAPFNRRRHALGRRSKIKKLYIIRHGEAEKRGAEGDAARALTARGSADCRLLAAHLKGTGAAWDAILCSSARRARESAELLAAAMASPPPLEVRDDLNLAGVETLLAVLRALPEEAGAALLVGHNPGLHALAVLLAGAGGGRAARRAARDFPPGALAELACDTPAWAHLAPGAATLRAFTTPKDIR